MSYLLSADEIETEEAISPISDWIYALYCESGVKCVTEDGTEVGMLPLMLCSSVI